MTRSKQAAKSVRDMLLSMAVVCAGAFFIFLFLPNDPDQDPVRPVQYEVEAVTASRAAPYELLAPEGLSEEWRATSVRYRHQGEHGATWRVGFMDPDNEYASVHQADGPADAFVAAVTHEAEATGETVRIAGEEWAYHEGPKYDALVLRSPDVTTVVTGTAPFERLEHLAAALAPRPGAVPAD
ncbi:DUF4245 domain-containing protein [Streptomyces sodiiphilus]|uniref:DUF4245 domain-containing protein n=1 Tax=Streptomyces sodiiphilus TaxID=226217 RepID=A0ABN2P0E2_9ACTN